MADGKRQCRITGSTVTTAGVTYDGKYSLSVNEVDGMPCLCLHKCELRDGLHYSTLDEKSLVAVLDRDRLEAVLRLIDGPVWAAVGRKGGGDGRTRE